MTDCGHCTEYYDNSADNECGTCPLCDSYEETCHKYVIDVANELGELDELVDRKSAIPIKQITRTKKAIAKVQRLVATK
jgi:hypothetical protein